MKAPSLKGTTRVIVVLLPMVSTAQLSHAQDGTAANIDLLGTLNNLGRHSLLVDALQRTGMAASLQKDGPYTLFAPTDAAIAAFSEDSLASMSREQLTAVLRYHLLTDVVSQEEAATLGELMTVHGAAVTAEMSDEGVLINDESVIIVANIEAANGVIHAIDTVLLPPGGPGDPEGSDGESG